MTWSLKTDAIWSRLDWCANLWQQKPGLSVCLHGCLTETQSGKDPLHLKCWNVNHPDRGIKRSSSRPYCCNVSNRESFSRGETQEFWSPLNKVTPQVKHIFFCCPLRWLLWPSKYCCSFRGVWQLRLIWDFCGMRGRGSARSCVSLAAATVQGRHTPLPHALTEGQT